MSRRPSLTQRMAALLERLLDRVPFALETVLGAVPVSDVPSEGRLSAQEALAPSVAKLAAEARALVDEHRRQTDGR